MSSPQDTKSGGGGTDPPSLNEINYDGKEYIRVREGLADILTPRPTQAGGDDHVKQSVFYNPIQQFNRDLSVLAVRVFAEDLTTIRRARHDRRLQVLAKGGKKRRQNGDGHAGGIRDLQEDKTDEGCKSSRGKKGSQEKKSHSEEGEELKEPKTVQGAEVSSDKKRNREEEGHPGEAEDVREVKRVKSSEMFLEAGREEPSNAIKSAKQQQDIEDTTSGNLGTVRVDGQPSGNTDAATDLTNGQAEEAQNGHNHPKGRQDHYNSDQSRLKNGSSPTATPPFRILDALSATGLRALRYAKEISHVTFLTANDLSPSATASIKLNVAYNGLAEKISPTTGDARAVMRHAANNGKDSYHVVDLDPYGTAAPFLDAAVQAVTDGGLLCVTCTDAGIYASVSWPEKTYSQYGGLPWRGPQNHEASLRLILHAVATSAARYGLAAEPLLSLKIDFYVRLFIRVKRAPVEVKCHANKTMVVWNCDHGCGAFTTQYLAYTREKEAKNGDKFHTHTLAQGPTATPHCEHCGFKTHLAGPMWGGPLHNPHFVSRILDLLPALDNKIYGTIPRIEGMLTLALNETLFHEPPSIASAESAGPKPITPLDPALRDPHPFFFNPSTLSRTLKSSRPSDAQWRGALIGLGYRTTRSHTEPGSIRTDASWHVIWEIMREWVRQKHPIKEGALTKGMAGWEILQKDRSRRSLNNAKQELRDALDKAGSVEHLRESVEAVLYRIGKEAAKGTTDIDGTNGSSEQATVSEGHGELKVLFDEKLGKEAGGKKLLRYQMNPRPEWGPMSKAIGGP